MINTGQSPPLRWFFGDADQRRLARRYWISDVALGLYETATHHTLRYLSIDRGSDIGAAISNVSRHFFPDSEKRARKAWIKLRPNESDSASIDAAMTRLWRCVSRTMAEFSTLDRLWVDGRIAVEGAEHLDRARVQHKPVIGAMLHLGNWEVIPVTCTALGHGGFGIYMPPENRFQHRIAVSVRDRLNLKLIPPGPQSGRAVIRGLEQPDARFAIYIDELIRGRVQAPAFGRRLRAEGNIAYAVRLAAMTGALIMPMYCLRLGDAARFKVTILPPVDLVRTGNKDADLMENISRLDAIITPIIIDHLDQWYFLLDFEFDS